MLDNVTLYSINVSSPVSAFTQYVNIKNQYEYEVILKFKIKSKNAFEFGCSELSRQKYFNELNSNLSPFNQSIMLKNILDKIRTGSMIRFDESL